MRKDLSVENMKRRYRQLTARLAQLGPVLQGTITERRIVRDDPQRPGEQKTYGPYYQWTFKRNAKTVTVNLTAIQAKVFQRAIASHRKLQQTLEAMRTLSLDILESVTKSVKKRKPRT